MKVAVIGAGVGGLSGAIHLAASGHDVTLFESAAAPGGRMREHFVGDAAIDSGPTVFTMRWVFDELLALANTSLDERLTLHHASELARHFWLDGSSLDLFADLGKSRAAIREFAGDQEAQAYGMFAARAERVFHTLDESFMRREKPSMLGLPRELGLKNLQRLIETTPWTSLWRQLGKDFADGRLRQLFARYATYCGSSPLEAPATLMLIAHAEREGVWLIEDGMQRFAEVLANVAVELGVNLRLQNEVAEITVANRRTSGVLLADGEGHACDAVLYNGDVNALSGGYLGDAVCAAVTDRRTEARSLSAFTMSVVVRRCRFPLKYHTVFFGNDYPAEFSAIFERGTVCAEPTIYVCAQDRAGHKAEKDTERLFLLMNAPPRDLTAEEVSDYRQLMLRTLEAHGLILDIQDEVVTSPNDFAARFSGTNGAIYGWPTHGMNGSFRRSGSRSNVPGLYLAGGSVHPGPGIPMVALSGRIAARAIQEDHRQSSR